MSDVIGWFADIGLADRPHVGGKGGSLGELQRAGIAVPSGFVVQTGAFERFITALEREFPVRARVASLNADDLDAIIVATREIRARVSGAALPSDVLEEVSAGQSALCGANSQTPVAVRSSATTEDAVDASFAGLQDTYLWVTSLNQTLQRVRGCWASLYSVESVSYRRKRGLPEEGVAMA